MGPEGGLDEAKRARRPTPTLTRRPSKPRLFDMPGLPCKNGHAVVSLSSSSFPVRSAKFHHARQGGFRLQDWLKRRPIARGRKLRCSCSFLCTITEKSRVQGPGIRIAELSLVLGLNTYLLYGDQTELGWRVVSVRDLDTGCLARTEISHLCSEREERWMGNCDASELSPSLRQRN